MAALDHVLYALVWASFGLIHSWLAGDAAKAVLAPKLGAGYRLAYNLLAVLHIGVVLLIGYLLLGDRPEFDRSGAARIVMFSLHVGGWAALLWSLRYYDLGRFSGLAQLRARRRGEMLNDDEPLRLDGPHAWVRHPLYAAAHVVLWSAATTLLALQTAVWGSLYLLIGSYFEERRLLARYGEAYAAYRRQVPSLIPWKGRALR